MCDLGHHEDTPLDVRRRVEGRSVEAPFEPRRDAARPKETGAGLAAGGTHGSELEVRRELLRQLPALLVVGVARTVPPALDSPHELADVDHAVVVCIHALDGGSHHHSFQNGDERGHLTAVGRVAKLKIQRNVAGALGLLQHGQQLRPRARDLQAELGEDGLVIDEGDVKAGRRQHIEVAIDEADHAKLARVNQVHPVLVAGHIGIRRLGVGREVQVPALPQVVPGLLHRVEVKHVSGRAARELRVDERHDVSRW